MRTSPGPPLRRALALALTLLAVAAAPPAPAAEAGRVPFAERYRALQHGGLVRAANTSITCRTASATCPGEASNDGTDMFYVDVDRDPNTYNSSRAEVRLPAGARVTYARLYWGGNLRVGEQKPPKDDGRVLIAEPGGDYKELLADTLIGHRVAQGADAYQASADVTELVRASGSGLYTVAQVNAAMGRSAAGAWGGWTLVAAYENPAEPLRHLVLWDGFDTLDPGVTARIRAPLPKGAGGRVGLVAYDGDRGRTGESFTLSTDSRSGGTFTDAANPRTDVLNSTISEPGTAPALRMPSPSNTLGYDSDVFDLGKALRSGGDQLAFRLVSQRDAAWAGALFVAVDARK
ncbi:DUF3344 domain-containing protein [Streptomyces sp. NPDC047072]|uniref:DUF3344 domain-containing protein n=1 Tax=Streptomyces sp. NPDC047072 TaxID=3154809 RepID=UPI0033C70186